MVFFNCFAKYVANLYPGLFFELTIGLIGFPSLCNFMVPYICGASGSCLCISICLFVLLFFLHVLIAVFIGFVSVIIRYSGEVVFFVKKSSIF
jgi:hypothetical protein